MATKFLMTAFLFVGASLALKAQPVEVKISPVMKEIIQHWGSPQNRQWKNVFSWSDEFEGRAGVRESPQMKAYREMQIKDQKAFVLQCEKMLQQLGAKYKKGSVKLKLWQSSKADQDLQLHDQKNRYILSADCDARGVALLSDLNKLVWPNHTSQSYMQNHAQSEYLLLRMPLPLAQKYGFTGLPGGEKQRNWSAAISPTDWKTLMQEWTASKQVTVMGRSALRIISGETSKTVITEEAFLPVAYDVVDNAESSSSSASVKIGATEVAKQNSSWEKTPTQMQVLPIYEEPIDLGFVVNQTPTIDEEANMIEAEINVMYHRHLGDVDYGNEIKMPVIRAFSIQAIQRFEFNRNYLLASSYCAALPAMAKLLNKDNEAVEDGVLLLFTQFKHQELVPITSAGLPQEMMLLPVGPRMRRSLNQLAKTQKKNPADLLRKLLAAQGIKFFEQEMMHYDTENAVLFVHAQADKLKKAYDLLRQHSPLQAFAYEYGEEREDLSHDINLNEVKVSLPLAAAQQLGLSLSGGEVSHAQLQGLSDLVAQKKAQILSCNHLPAKSGNTSVIRNVLWTSFPEAWGKHFTVNEMLRLPEFDDFSDLGSVIDYTPFVDDHEMSPSLTVTSESPVFKGFSKAPYLMPVISNSASIDEHGRFSFNQWFFSLTSEVPLKGALLGEERVRLTLRRLELKK